ncbi:MAG: CoA pyrophosphatase [Elusimicrobia bacterium]|nr:CoA pyrophosphatase [Elusimicrobiota bacterium]
MIDKRPHPLFDSLTPRLAAARRNPPRPGLLETSVALMLAPGERGLEALFIRRAVRAGDPWSGNIGLPGGRREAGDADLLATAIRETREEIGVDLPPGALLGALDDLQPSTPALPPLMIRPFVFGVSPRPEAGTSAEVAASFWVPLESLHAARSLTKVSIREKSVEVPCFKLPDLPEGLVVWGLTYRIVNGLLPLLP